jgi:hypothetical protein
MQVKRTRKSRIKLASATVNSMLRLIQAYKKVIDDDNVMNLINRTREELEEKI